ncbi:non-ribosomal peptide synthetase [Paenibacillus sp. P46E]|uniref:non-ribosomal peptide synthetase n=1 Tax=Paenibacillus sp. P46E TaxID=1349436 RepID=UPI00093BD091|nr:non-ribosomal peptide synthetase [Paenibacillus sp. P46E]OKP97601.1 non-ribosomal peptide synthetase [Paenibacillus sp. P46E]
MLEASSSNEKQAANALMKIEQLSLVSPVWNAFISRTSRQLTPAGRLEDKIILPQSMSVSLNGIIGVAAMLGGLVSSEGRVMIGIHDQGSSTCLEIDATKLQDTGNIQEFITKLRLTEELDREKVTYPVDIEVTDGTSLPPADSLVWLVVQDDQCVLSVREDCMDYPMYEHLRKVVDFACAKAVNFYAAAAVDTLPAKSTFEKNRRYTSLAEYVFKYKEMNPSGLAIVDDINDEHITYAELWEASGGVVRQLCEHISISQSQLRIALFMERGWRYLTSIVAVQRLGGTCILMDTANPDDRIRGFLSETRPDAILVDANTDKRARGVFNVPLLDFDEAAYPSPAVQEEQWDGGENHNGTCFIAGTSGTTGRPKAVCLSYSGMSCTIEAIVDSARLDQYSRGTWLSSPGYGMIEVDPLPVLCAGGTVCIPSHEVMQDIGLLTKWFDKKSVTHTLVMTSVAEAIWAYGAQTSLRTMLIAGERCKQWPPAELNYQVLNIYGSAEAAVVSIEDLSGVRRTILPTVGRAIPGANMYIVDSKGKELPALCVGELVITGETLSLGYIDDLETQKSFRPNTLDTFSTLQYSSGDRARAHLDGAVEIFGRTDSLVKIRGHRVDLAEIEIAALEVPGVAKAAAKAFTHDEGTMLALFIEQAPYTDDVTYMVRNHLSEKLPSAALPNQISLMILPLGRNGKVDYDLLRSDSLEQDSLGHVFAPTTEVDIFLRDCWLTWSGCKEVTLESNFLHSGGDSLRAMRMMSELSCKYGIHIQMSSFLEKPVFSHLVYLANSSRNNDLPPFEHLSASHQLESFELNESQQALWIGRGPEFNYGGVGCQGYFEWEVEHLDFDRFIQAVGLLVDRHPMLRMTIDEDGLQRIGAVDGRKAVEYQDLRSLSPDEMNKEINRVRDDMANDEIGTTQWPLFHFRVSQISDSKSRVHLSIDMLVADAWSIFQIIIPDLIDLYAEEQPDLPSLNTTFQEYVHYRNTVRQSEVYRTHREYWLEKIKALPPAPKLPQLDPGQSNQMVKFDRHEGILDQASWSRLKAQAQERKISSSGVVALVLCEVLRSWSEENKFTLNFPVSDRMAVSDDIDLVVGDFTNTLLVPYETDAADTLAARGRRLQDAIWEALDHRLFTGVEVLRELSRLRKVGREPLMPVVLTSLLGHPGRHDASRFGREVFGVSQTPQVTLDVQIRESEGSLFYKWDYLTGVIRPDVIKAMFDSFCKLLQQLADNSEIWERTWLELRPTGQIAVRQQVNSTEQQIPEVHLRELLLERIIDRPNLPAIIDSKGTYTWSEIGRAAAHVKMLIQQVCGSSERFVGIMLPKGGSQYAAVYGCLLAGKGYIPLDMDLPSERVGKILAQANVKAVITSPGTALPVDVIRVEHSTGRLGDWIQQSRELTYEAVPENYSPYIIFTSGSTGEPKGVEIPEIAVVNHIFDVAERFNLDESTRHLATAALHFDMSVFDIFGPLVHGGSAVIPEHAAGPDPESWLRLHRQHEVTFWACVPAVMDLVCCVGESTNTTQPIPSVANIVMAGDWIPLSLIPRAQTVFPAARMFSCGGPTETTNWSIIHEIDSKEGSICRSVIYGVPMRNSKYLIISEDWIERPDWVPGEMLVESDISLARGYVGQEELTKLAFVNHPRTGRRMYRTGDLGRYLPNGEIEILGRVDNQIKINGLRIELGEIEKATEDCEGVMRACAVALPGNDGRLKHIALAYVGGPRPELISQSLSSRLPVYMVPKLIKNVPQLPLSKNGKVDVKLLRDILSKTEVAGSPVMNQRNLLRVIVHAISVQLAQEVVLPEDNFLDLGGDSMAAMKLKIELEAKLSTKVPLESILLTDTIRDLANDLAERMEP